MITLAKNNRLETEENLLKRFRKALVDDFSDIVRETDKDGADRGAHPGKGEDARLEPHHELGVQAHRPGEQQQACLLYTSPSPRD